VSDLTIRLFGPFELEPKLEPLSRKSKWLLSLLALRQGREVDRGWLAGTLWPDTSEELALYNLRRELSRLRRALGSQSSRLRPSPGHALSLEGSGTSVDVVAFDEAVARRDEHSLEQAVALYSGPLLEDCSEEWVIEEREARAQAYLAALDALAAHATSRNELAAAVRYLRLLVAADPLREDAQRRLIQALAATGAYGAATRTYRELRLDLKRNLQTEPAPETRVLHQNIVAQAHAKATAPHAAVRGRVPRPITQLIGRSKEIEEVAARVRVSRVVALVGAGGVGKSRLAVEVGAVLAADFAAGVWFVELAALSDPALVVSSVASAIGLRVRSPQPTIEALCEYLRYQQVLLVLDNCEHVINSCGALAARLLTACEGLRILATSRQPLGMIGEVAWRVPSLAESDAVQLFLERAEDAQPVSSVRANLDTVALICRQLDGIPLAIELAAVRTKSLSLAQIAERLDARFQLLTSGNRAALPRHQTLRATMDWSYQLLSDAERRLLSRLAVFAGGWTLEAAERVCGDTVLDTLSALIDKSLVVFDGRYRMLETVRQYARERMSASGEQAEYRDRHLAYFVGLAEEAEPHIFGGEHDKSWVVQLEVEHDNVRAAFDWAETNDSGAESALRMVAALHWFWFARSHITEGHARMTAALRRREQASDPVQGRALAAAGFVAMWMGDFANMRAPLREALMSAERVGDDRLRSYALCGLGAAALFLGDLTEAGTLLQRAVAIARGLDSVLTIFALYWLATLGEAAADFAAARRVLRDGIALANELQNKPALAHLHYRHGHCAHTQGELGEARTHYVASLEVLVETGDQWGLSQALDALGCLAADEGDAERATAVLGAAETVRLRVGAQILPSEQKDHDRAVLAARGAQGDEAFADAWTKGRELPLNEALEMARNRGRVRRPTGVRLASARSDPS
jgi:non-specific serine/threonine protein kinase